MGSSDVPHTSSTKPIGTVWPTDADVAAIVQQLTQPVPRARLKSRALRRTARLATLLDDVGGSAGDTDGADLDNE